MTPERPAYFEGQILAAADLTSAVDYGRGQVARHERYLHDWGIAEGLELTTAPDSSGQYFDVTLQPGVAIDGDGREIIVPTSVLLSTAEFFIANGASPQAGANYPILLYGLDTSPPAAMLTTGACGPGGQPTRTEEGFGLTYGALGADLTLDGQQVPDVTAGPVPAAGNQWQVLVGFVQCDASGQHFTAASMAGVRYAGVKADTVSARSGTLALRSQLTATSGQPVLVVGGDPLGLTFGLYQGGSSYLSLLTVSAQGDVTAAGTIVGKGLLNQGEVLVESGTVTDGLIIPLPSGISQDQVDNGNVTVHLFLTLHTPQAAAGSWYVPVDCSVDANRQLSCQVMIGTGTVLSGVTLQQQSGAADYLIVATVAGATS